MENIIRKVRGLGGRVKKQALDKGLDEEDLVIVKTTINQSLPQYELEKIEGSIMKYLEDNYLN